MYVYTDEVVKELMLYYYKIYTQLVYTTGRIRNNIITYSIRGFVWHYKLSPGAYISRPVRVTQCNTHYILSSSRPTRHTYYAHTY